MEHKTSGRLESLLRADRHPRILLIGDIMLDRYLWGDVERISPEAPIPVLRVGKQEHRLGGAGSVATMLAAMDAWPLSVTVVGDDREGHIVREILEASGLDASCVITDPRRPTTVKERLLGRSHHRDPHHMMRVDREDSRPIDTGLADRLLAAVAESLDSVDLVLVSDYDKGVCAGNLIPRLVELVQSRVQDLGEKPILADPVRGADYRRYAGCACITPNRAEAGAAARMEIREVQDGLEAAKRILDFGVEAVAVTMDRDGIAWADQHGNTQHFPGRPRPVCDVTGAGDMVLSALAYAMATGANFATAIQLANLAGGLEVEQLGVVPLSRRELLDELAKEGIPVNCPQDDQKILTVEQLTLTLDQHRLAGDRIAMTNGCFDLLHPGHVSSLQEARKQGDCLVVGLNSDQSVRLLKGNSRPILDERGRAEMLAALACVDYVVLFDDESVAPLIERIKPDVLVKAAQYAATEIVGHEIVATYGGRVASVPMKSGYSTTSLIDRIHALRDETMERRTVNRRRDAA